MRVLLSVAILAARAAAFNWTSIESLPFGRSDMAVGVLGGLAYIVGGCDGDQHCNVNAGFCSCPTITNSVTIFNPVLNQYKRGRSAPRPRYRHNVCTWNDDKLFVFGGRDTSDAIIREVDVYTASTNLWSTLADPLPADLGSDNSCSMMLDAIYLAGGYAADYSVAFNSTYRFSPTAGTWTRMNGQMSVARGDFSSVAFQDRMHVYGGYTTADFCAPIAHHEIYDPQADAWSVAEPLPAGVAEKDDAIVLNDKIYAIGGERKAVTSGCTDLDLTPVREVWAYDLVRAGWTPSAPLPDARMRFASAVVNDSVYLFGGQGPLEDGSFFPILYSALKYDADGVPAASPSPAAVAAASVANNTFSVGSMVGAVIGTFIATLALAMFVGCLLNYRQARLRRSADVGRLQKQGAQIQL